MNPPVLQAGGSIRELSIFLTWFFFPAIRLFVAAQVVAMIQRRLGPIDQA